MKTTALSLIAVAGLVLTTAVFAGSKSYQVTGTVLEVTATKIVVQKGTDRWELDVGPETKGSGGSVKVGDKVTITYTMAATKIDARSGKKMGATKIGAQKKEGPAERMADSSLPPDSQ